MFPHKLDVDSSLPGASPDLGATLSGYLVWLKPLFAENSTVRMHVDKQFIHEPSFASPCWSSL